MPTSTAVRSIGLVRLLGAVDATTEEGVVVSLPSQTQRRLVAVLALHAPDTVRAEYLCANLDIGPGALRNTVSRLRRTFGSAVITSSLGYGLEVPVDAHHFERLFRSGSDQAHGSDEDRLAQLDEALSLWHGDALAEFQDEPWAEADVARLNELRWAAVDERALRLLSHARAAEAVAELETQVARHPLRDRSRGLLLRALAASGRQADALRAYQQYRMHLAEEVGTEPSNDVRDIERRISGGWNGLGEDRRSDRRPARPGETFKTPLPAVLVREGNSRVSDDPMTRRPEVVGRLAELAVLHVEFSVGPAVRGPRTVIVGGEPGIGKTTLISTFAQSVHASGNVTVVAGRCDEHGSAVLQPFRDVTAFLVNHLPIDLLEQHIGAVGTHIGRLAPNLAQRLGRDTSVEPTDDLTGRYLLFEAVADLFRRVAAVSRLVLVLDDLHWAEVTTLLLVRHLHRALGDTDMLILVTHRDSESDRSDALRGTFAALERGRSRRLNLIGLKADEFEDLVTRIVGEYQSVPAADSASAGSGQGAEPGPERIVPYRPALQAERVGSPNVVAPEFVQQVFQETSGNPLYTVHLVRRLVESSATTLGRSGLHLVRPLDTIELPHTIRDVVWSRVTALGETTARLLTTAAVLGREFNPDVLRALSECTEAELIDAVEAGARAGLLLPLIDGRDGHDGGDGRDGRDGQGSGAVRFTHALVAHALYYELSAIRRRQLHAKAASVLSESTNETPDLAINLARHHSLAGEHREAMTWSAVAGDNALDHYAPHEAARWFEMALDHARALEGGGVAADTPSLNVAQLTLRLGQAQRRAGTAAARATLLEAAAMAVRLGATDVLIQSALSNTRGFQMVADADLERLDFIEKALCALTAVGHPVGVEAELLALLSQELIHTPQYKRRIESAERSLTIAQDADDPALLVRVAPFVLSGLWEPGRAAQRREVALAAMSAAEGVHDPLLQFQLFSSVGNVGLQFGDQELARTSMTLATNVAAAVADPSMRWLLLLKNIFELTMAGDLIAAESSAELAYTIGEESGEPDAFVIYAGQLGVIRSLQGRHEEIYPLVEQSALAMPDHLALQLYYACISMDVGRFEISRGILSAGATLDFQHVPFDFTWATSMSSYAILASGLGEADIAKRLLDLMEPFADEICFNGAASLGSMSAHVAPLATLVGRYDDSERYMLDALEVHRNFGWAFHEASALIGLARNRRAQYGVLDEQARSWLADAADIADRQSLVRLQNAIAALLV